MGEVMQGDMMMMMIGWPEGRGMRARRRPRAANLGQGHQRGLLPLVLAAPRRGLAWLCGWVSAHGDGMKNAKRPLARSIEGRAAHTVSVVYTTQHTQKQKAKTHVKQDKSTGPTFGFFMCGIKTSLPPKTRKGMHKAQTDAPLPLPFPNSLCRT